MAGKGGVPHNKERLAAIVRMREEGKTYEAIGRSFDPPITRERVRQILAKHGKAGRINKC